jgi:hypothetical protein
MRPPRAAKSYHEVALAMPSGWTNFDCFRLASAALVNGPRQELKIDELRILAYRRDCRNRGGTEFPGLAIATVCDSDQGGAFPG